MHRAAYACLCFAALLVQKGLLPSARATDGPASRGDAGRTAYPGEKPADKLYLQWLRQLPPQVPAWKDEETMQFDRSYRPVVAGETLFLGSTVNDSVTAYDLGSGAEKWRFYTDGPVRMMPAAWQDRLLVASDDGHLYCLDAADGTLQWRFRGGPRDRRLLGNERLISAWPARGGPVVADGTVYFAAGVWPFMGTFVHALDIQTGRLAWTNDSTSSPWQRVPHGAMAFSGLSPQGHLTVSGNRLVVPGARSQPGVFDRTTGEFLYFGGGQGPEVTALQVAGSPAKGPPERTPEIRKSLFESRSEREKAHSEPVFPDKIDDLSGAVWQETVRNSVSGTAVAGGRLILVAVEGNIYCYGPRPVKPRTYDRDRRKPLAPNGASDRAAEILKLSGAGEGYCLVLGLCDGGLVESLLQQSDLHVIAVDADPAKILALRRRLDAAGLYGARAGAVLADPATVEIAPYMASLIVSEDAQKAGLNRDPETLRRLLQTLRPYGGTACLTSADLESRALELGVRPSRPQSGQDARAPEDPLASVEIERAGDWTLLVRGGPLPGSGPWLGQNANAGNARCSRDRLVMAPLGVLWFGNALSNRLILPRHGEGPVEQVCGGRLFIEGPDELSAADVYTGRFLWTRRFAGLGKIYDSIEHQPGAHVVGSNFFVAPDAVYVAAGKFCHVLDPASGRALKEFKLPLRRGDKRPSDWQFLMVYEDLLIAGSHPVVIESRGSRTLLGHGPTSSKVLVAMERRSGAVLWTRDAAGSFLHYGICAGGGKVFCVDSAPPEAIQRAARRGEKPPHAPRILALEARTGNVVWQTGKHVGTQLVYSAEHDVLLAGAALRGKDGELLWENAAAAKAIWAGTWGPMLRGDTIFTQSGTAYDLLTGKPHTVKNVSGKDVAWTYSRAHGCSPASAGEHLLTFRSGTAGYCDLKNQSGTGNLGGFRSGCTSNLIAADGVLNAPDYTRTCSCSYANRSSLALIHDPEAEAWTYAGVPSPGRVAYNLGSPGDRRDGDGTLWRASPQLADPNLRERPLVATAPAAARRFVHHASRIRGGQALPWVAASGLVGIRSAKVPLEGLDPRKPITLRLVFVEPQDAAAGQRVFGVAVNGKEVLTDLDVVEEAGGPWRGLVKEIRDVDYPTRASTTSGSLEIAFTPKAGEPVLCGIELRQD